MSHCDRCPDSWKIAPVQRLEPRARFGVAAAQPAGLGARAVAAALGRAGAHRGSAGIANRRGAGATSRIWVPA
jgi:hypothetical protein